MQRMRIALVSPYSWTYPGGVTRHIQALAEQLLAEGHYVRVLAPYDPVDLHSTILHRGATPQALPMPDYLMPLGRTVGFKANGSVSNLTITPHGVAALHNELRSGGYDVVHIHEPIAPLAGWVATDSTRLPLVGTFHSYSESKLANGLANAMGARRMLNRLHVRIAVSEAAAWTGRRFFGGHYRVIPNGVRVDPDVLARAGAPRRTDRLAIVFVGQSVERKGLPLLLRSFEALREHIPAELTVIGPTRGARSADARRSRRPRAGQGRRCAQARGAAARRRPVRAVAGRGELRDGADRGVRRRHPGDRIRHRRLPRRRP
jgi:phosphatidylinositol alpha-mannosyltransferase